MRNVFNTYITLPRQDSLNQKGSFVDEELQDIKVDIIIYFGLFYK